MQEWCCGWSLEEACLNKPQRFILAHTIRKTGDTHIGWSEEGPPECARGPTMLQTIDANRLAKPKSVLQDISPCEVFQHVQLRMNGCKENMLDVNAVPVCREQKSRVGRANEN